MGHELAEEPLIAVGGCAIAQLACQFGHELQRRGVLPERVQRVMGNIGNHRDRAAGAGGVRRDQDDATQARVHHRQVVIVDGFVVPLQLRAIIEHTLHDIKGLLVDVVLHQGHMRGDIECVFLAENDFMAQDFARRFVRGT
ncbi:hypothetical protein D3C87_1103290 [compost metagenome]